MESYFADNLNDNPPPMPVQSFGSKVADFASAMFGAPVDRQTAFYKGVGDAQKYRQGEADYRYRNAQTQEAMDKAALSRAQRLAPERQQAIWEAMVNDPTRGVQQSDYFGIADGAGDLGLGLQRQQDMNFSSQLAGGGLTPEQQSNILMAQTGKPVERFYQVAPGEGVQDVFAPGYKPVQTPMAQLTQDSERAKAENYRELPANRGGAGGNGLPLGALKIVDEATQAIGASEQSEQLGQEALNLISGGKVDLSVANNLVARGRNYIGESTPESRAYASVQQALEKLRNNYLLLAKGVQTEGDAKRAWESEIGEAAAFDNKLAEQQLQKALTLIEMTRNLQDRRIQNVYDNFRIARPGAPAAAAAPGAPPAAAPVPSRGAPIAERLSKSGRPIVTYDGINWEYK